MKMDSKTWAFKGCISYSHTVISLKICEWYYLYCSRPKLISWIFYLFINLVAQWKDHLYENLTVTYQPLSTNKNKTINCKSQVIKIFEIKMWVHLVSQWWTTNNSTFFRPSLPFQNSVHKIHLYFSQSKESWKISFHTYFFIEFPGEKR